MFCGRCGVEAGEGQQFCSGCGNALDLTVKVPAGGPTAGELSARLSKIEARLPQSMLLNQKFWPRAFAVLGHYLAVVGVLYGAIFAIAIVVGILAAIVTVVRGH